MMYRQLGASALKPSVIGIGGLHFGTLCDPMLSVRLIDHAFDLGLNFIDTAPMYGNGNSESIIRQAIRGKRHQFILASKVGLEPNLNEVGQFGVKTIALTELAIRESVEKSLRALGTEYLDLLQLHAFDPYTPADETLSVLNSLVEEGKIRFIGCSNYDAEHLHIMQKAVDENRFHGFVSLQSHYNMLERRLEQEVIPLTKTLGISIMCYRALARGILSHKYKLDQDPPPGSRGSMSERVRRKLTPATLTLVDHLQGYCGDFGRTLGDLAIAWLISRPQVAVLILGVRSLDQLVQNVAALDWRLSDHELVSVDELIKSTGFMSQVLTDPEVFLET